MPDHRSHHPGTTVAVLLQQAAHVPGLGSGYRRNDDIGPIRPLTRHCTDGLELGLAIPAEQQRGCNDRGHHR
jgi:hypothetical protein